MTTATTAVLAAGLLVGISTVQKSFRAADHHAKSQVEQIRILDYIARDLRRALWVKVDSYNGGQRITVKIPDYYDVVGTPRDPVIKNGGIAYGNANDPVVVSYYKEGSTIYRSVDGNAYELATNVKDFQPVYSDDGKQVINVSVSFVPKFQINARDVSELRTGTATFSSTLLRNKRVTDL